MCGIIGVLAQSAPIDVPRLVRARDTLIHRGPDAAGLWIREAEDSSHVAFGHRRLSILDLSERSAQPLVLDEAGNVEPSPPSGRIRGRLVLAFNGEIYNYVELRDELRGCGHVIRSTGDVEVLLRAYAQWGPACVERLNGMFAFSVWDESRRELFCARDRFGEKPFHYALSPDQSTFAFASEVKALAAYGVAEGELEPRAIFRYFRFGESAGVEQTIWKGVHRLLPAHTLTVRFGRDRLTLSSRRYWDLDPDAEQHIAPAAAATRFRELFRDSVRLRLRSDVALGTSLSGGLDSSSVLCQIQDLGAASGQRAFSARMEDPGLDEGQYIAAVLASTGVAGFSVVPVVDDFLDGFDALCFHQEDPFPTTSVFAAYAVQRLAAQHGVTVLLDGQGADEYLAGYKHYGACVLTDLSRHGHLYRWWTERRAYRARSGDDPVPVRAAIAHLAAYGRGASPLPVQAPKAVPFLRTEFRDEFASEQPRGVAARSDSLKTRLYADLMCGHLQELLRYADRNSMAFSREVRLPFLDHRLVEFAMSLPREQLWYGGESKRVLRAAMRGLVPNAVLDRRDKIGFAAPSDAWWEGRAGAALHGRLAHAISSLDDALDPRASYDPNSALSVITIESARRQLQALAAKARVTSNSPMCA
ncbi:MAG TPA: asparagine synthase (glutamine-hydrolyzing) [Vicinamibacterales bacterium]|nr:asparagine synthase (glutamine-hydrolyzing) [Vicinamibacterales bacterium]